MTEENKGDKGKNRPCQAGLLMGYIEPAGKPAGKPQLCKCANLWVQDYVSGGWWGIAN